MAICVSRTSGVASGPCDSTGCEACDCHGPTSRLDMAICVARTPGVASGPCDSTGCEACECHGPTSKRTVMRAMQSTWAPYMLPGNLRLEMAICVTCTSGEASGPRDSTGCEACDCHGPAIRCKIRSSPKRPDSLGALLLLLLLITAETGNGELRNLPLR